MTQPASWPSPRTHTDYRHASHRSNRKRGDSPDGFSTRSPRHDPVHHELALLRQGRPTGVHKSCDESVPHFLGRDGVAKMISPRPLNVEITEKQSLFPVPHLVEDTKAGRVLRTHRGLEPMQPRLTERVV